MLSLGTRTGRRGSRPRRARPARATPSVPRGRRSRGARRVDRLGALFPQDEGEPPRATCALDGQMYATRSGTRASKKSHEGPLWTAASYETWRRRSSSTRSWSRSRSSLSRRAPSWRWRGARAEDPRRPPRRPVDGTFPLRRTPLVNPDARGHRDALRRLHEWEARGHRYGASVQRGYRMISDGELVCSRPNASSKAPMSLRSAWSWRCRPPGLRPARARLRLVVKHASAPGCSAGCSTTSADITRSSRSGCCRRSDQVKIDSMFLHEAGRGGRADAIVRSLVNYHRTRGTPRPSPRASRASSRGRRRSHSGCDLAQGFYTSGTRCPRRNSPTGSVEPGRSWQSRARGQARPSAATGRRTGRRRRRRRTLTAKTTSARSSIDVFGTGSQSAAARTPTTAAPKSARAACTVACRRMDDHRTPARAAGTTGRRSRPCKRSAEDAVGRWVMD